MSNVDVAPAATPAPAATETAPAVTPVPGANPTLAAEAPPAAPVDPNAPKPAEGAKPAEAPAIAAIDPAKFTIPEGFTRDEDAIKSLVETLSDEKLAPQDRAQRLMDIHADVVKKVGEANTKAWTDLNEGWIKEAKADPEIGGAKLEATKTTIAKAIDSLGPDSAKAFRQALDMTGAGNNPAIIRGLNKWASQIVEGSHVTGTPPSGPKDTAAMFFPNSPDMK